MSRKWLYASPSEVLEASDVEVEQNRLIKVYCALNFIFYIGQMVTLLIVSNLVLQLGSFIDFKNPNGPYQSPLYVGQYWYFLGWLITFVLQGLFALRGLSCARATVHYKNCLMLKIKYNFVILCVVFTLTILAVAALTKQPEYL